MSNMIKGALRRLWLSWAKWKHFQVDRFAISFVVFLIDTPLDTFSSAMILEY